MNAPAPAPAAASALPSALAHEAAVEATTLWLNGDHESCMQTLQKLEHHERSLKVRHNLALAEHCSNGCKDPTALYHQLSALLEEASGRAAEPGAPSAADEDAAILTVNQAILLYRDHSYPKAISLLTPLLQHIDGLDEGTALHVLLLLLDMHLHQQDIMQAAAALAALNKACPELADSFAAVPEDPQQQQPQASPSAASTPRPSPASQPPAASGPDDSSPSRTPLLPSDAAAPPTHTSLPSVSKWGSATMQEACRLLTQAGHAPPHPPNLSLLLRLYRARLALLQHNTRAAKRELQAVLSMDPGHTASVGGQQQAPAEAAPPAGTPGPPEVAASGLVSSDAVAGALGVTTAESGSGPGPGSAALSAVHAASLAKAHLEVLRGSGRKAALALQGMLPDGGAVTAPTALGQLPLPSQLQPSLPLQPVVLNDLGVAHHHCGKHQLAALYFRQALDSLCEAAGTEGPASGVARIPGDGNRAEAKTAARGASQSGGKALGGRMSYYASAMTFNAGVQYAALGRYGAALRCFSRCEEAEAVGSAAAAPTATRPLLLLRTAQAALSLHLERQGAASSSEWSGAAPSEQAAQPHAAGPPLSLPGLTSAPAPAKGQELLHAALHWLHGAHGALGALRRRQQEESDAALAASTAAAVVGTTAGPPVLQLGPEEVPALGMLDDTSIQDHSHACLHQSILTHLAYVNLLLGDPTSALAAASQVLGLPNAAPTEAQATACYAAEALRALGREAEAMALLSGAEAAAAAGQPMPPGCPGAGGGLKVLGREAAEDSTGAVAVAGASAEQGAAAAAGGYAERAALCVNLVAMLAAGRGAEGGAAAAAEPQQAALRVKALAAEALELQPGSRPASLLTAYQNMMSGRCDDALAMLKQMHG